MLQTLVSTTPDQRQSPLEDPSLPIRAPGPFGTTRDPVQRQISLTTPELTQSLSPQLSSF